MGAIFILISGFLSARLIDHFGIKPILILGMILQTIGYLFLAQISIAESYFSGLLGPMLLIAFGTGFGFTAINIDGLMGTKSGEEGIASGLINTSRQIGGPIGLALLLTVANFGKSYHIDHLAKPVVAMVTGFDYAFLTGALLTGCGIIFACLFKQEKNSQDKKDTVKIHTN